MEQFPVFVSGCRQREVLLGASAYGTRGVNGSASMSAKVWVSLSRVQRRIGCDSKFGTAGIQTGERKAARERAKAARAGNWYLWVRYLAVF